MSSNSDIYEERKIGAINIVISKTTFSNDPRPSWDVYVVGNGPELELATEHQSLDTDELFSDLENGSFGITDERLLEILDNADLLGPECFECHKASGPTYHIVGADSNLSCCVDCWDERLR